MAFSFLLTSGLYKHPQHMYIRTHIHTYAHNFKREGEGKTLCEFEVGLVHRTSGQSKLHSGGGSSGAHQALGKQMQSVNSRPGWSPL